MIHLDLTQKNTKKNKRMKFKHGKSHNLKKGNVLYNRYNAIKNSCYNPNSKSYRTNGIRGIKMCDSWKSDFMEFHNWSIKNGFTNKRVLHRTNRDKDFSPDNCKWITYKTKNKLIAKDNPDWNKHNKSKLKLGDKVYSIRELSIFLKVSYSKLYYYLTRNKVGKETKDIDLSILNLKK